LTSFLWDFDNDIWVRVSSVAGEIDVPEPEPFVGPGGEVRVRVVGSQNAYFELTSSSIKLMVEP
jgi:hypothetical protein